MALIHRTLACIALVMALALTAPLTAQAQDKENTLYLDTKYGRVVIKLLPDIAPNHVKRIKTLTREGFYDGLKFHRVIDGFMAQTGDPLGTGAGGSDLPDLKAEFSNHAFKRGTIGMARTNNPNSANSQFFITFGNAPWLNRQYTVWGEVTSGMEYIDQINKGEPPRNPDVIVKMQVAADAAE
ncbi:peptidylprolyl isomerase [Cohaesibacter marisflavi]|uniref:Peptidyl-prolyl cis-trans isomerase n=2 Tax=Cohaesibacter marisflavi TaxID=655353 RepID=A0A1I5I9R7_9HYPH|nr:peptidylprolyl isomerase [Cohaesibacter marisflavi]